MTIADKFLDKLPDDTDGVVVVLSGGLDSTTSLRLAVAKYDTAKVRAISFDYRQKQRIELDLAAKSCFKLGVHHKVFDIAFLADINKGFSANVDKDIDMPTIKDVLGEPQPITYVANRNMILMSIAASYAEANGFDTILAGFQSNDQYNYWDTTPSFLQKLNSVLAENRQHSIRVVCPFAGLNKVDEIRSVLALDGNIDLFSSTITCYNPDHEGRSCGVCPSCSERKAAFKKLGLVDPIKYSEVQ